MQSLKSSIAEETFQTVLVMKALERLGYEVKPIKDPKLAKLFDANGDGKTDLADCNPDWGGEEVIEHQLTALWSARYRDPQSGQLLGDHRRHPHSLQQGRIHTYYTWTPYWVFGVLVPGCDVVWLQVPFSSLPGERKDVDTKLPTGENYGFQANTQHIIANCEFAEKNPAAAKLFFIMELNVNDISVQNLPMRDGEKSAADIERHADAWINANQKTFDGWIQEALKTARWTVQKNAPKRPKRGVLVQWPCIAK